MGRIRTERRVVHDLGDDQVSLRNIVETQRGAAVLGSIQPQPIDFSSDGSLSLEQVKKKIKPDDHHYARTRLLSFENTVGGKALPMNYLTEARDFCTQHNLALHLDGARVFNAAVFYGVDVAEITAKMDSVSICLSKGLGAPVGSVLCGSKAFIKEAHKWRKMLGGGMRQAGIIASAGLFALENNITRLAQDHNNASWLAEALSKIDGLKVTGQHTNMVFVDYLATLPSEIFASKLFDQGINICSSDSMRLVLHKNISKEDCERFVEVVRQVI